MLHMFISNLHRHLSRDEEGQTLAEYGLLLALIVIVVFVALLIHGPIISGIFIEMGDSLLSV
ncbi:MAG: Flp family type IVb pilin [Candidatus Limnocylindria bacterium]